MQLKQKYLCAVLERIPIENIERIEVVSSSGYEALDRAALKAVQRARFNPALQDDRPMTGTLMITLCFQLTE